MRLRLILYVRITNWFRSYNMHSHMINGILNRFHPPYINTKRTPHRCFLWMSRYWSGSIRHYWRLDYPGWGRIINVEHVVTLNSSLRWICQCPYQLTMILKLIRHPRACRTEVLIMINLVLEDVRGAGAVVVVVILLLSLLLTEVWCRA